MKTAKRTSEPSCRDTRLATLALLDLQTKLLAELAGSFAPIGKGDALRQSHARARVAITTCAPSVSRFLELHSE